MPASLSGIETNLATVLVEVHSHSLKARPRIIFLNEQIVEMLPTACDTLLVNSTQ